MKRRYIALLLTLILMLGIMPVQAKAASEQKLAAITFDDGPSEYTDGLLDELAKRDVSVTFFMQGCNAERYPEAVKKAYEAGHQISSHTYNHRELTKLKDKKIQYQLSTTDAILDDAIGVSNSYMLRPPYGSVNSHVLSVIDRPAILWSVDTLDWESLDADAVYQHIIDDTEDGSIVLLHDLYETSVSGALRGIDALLEQGYELVTVKELLRRRGVDAVSGRKYFSAAGSTTLPGISQPVITPTDTGSGYLISLSADEGAVIYYTTDGSSPTSQSTVYTEPFQTGWSVTIKAFAAYDLNGGRSQTSEVELEVPRTEKPSITLADDTATLSAEGAIYYTLDGTVPTTDAEQYNTPITVTAGTLVQAVAKQSDYRSSQVTSLLYSDLGNQFSDIYPADWYYNDVDRVVSQGLMTTDHLRFSPDKAVTRRDLVTVLYRMAGQPEVCGTYSFPDVADDNYAYDAIMWAVEQGILSGFDDGTIRPGNPVTREQLCMILYRIYPDHPASNLTMLRTYNDRGNARNYSQDAIDWAVSCGILRGTSDTTLSPDGTVTRAQLSSIILRYQTYEDKRPAIGISGSGASFIGHNLLTLLLTPAKAMSLHLLYSLHFSNKAFTSIQVYRDIDLQTVVIRQYETPTGECASVSDGCFFEVLTAYFLGELPSPAVLMTFRPPLDSTVLVARSRSCV